MALTEKEIALLNEMKSKLSEQKETKKKRSFWGGVRAGMQKRSEEAKTRRAEERQISREAFSKARQSEIKKRAAARGRASVTGFTYTASGNYNPIGALFDRGMKPAPRPRTKKGKKKGTKKGTTRAARGPNILTIDPVDNWGLW